jgi:hypothetical protein
VIVPHSDEARAKLNRQAKIKRMSLRDFARDEILGTMVMGRID